MVPADTFPTPTITLVAPTSLDPLGGTSFVVIGTGFMAAYPRPDAGASFTLRVRVGSVDAISFVVNSATQIAAVAPAGSVSTSVVVDTLGGCAVGPVQVSFGANLVLTEAIDTLTTEAGDRLQLE